MESFTNVLKNLSDVCYAPVVEFHVKHLKLMQEMPASLKYHHSWPGGYLQHIWEVCNMALALHKTLELPHKDYTLDDLLVAAYFHDVDKLLCRYERDIEKPTPGQVSYARDLGVVIAPLETKSTISAKIDAKKSGQPLDPKKVQVYTRRIGIDYSAPAMVTKICYDNGIFLTEMMLHAITYHEGGWSPAIEGNTQVQLIATILHAADHISSKGQNGAIPITL